MGYLNTCLNYLYWALQSKYPCKSSPTKQLTPKWALLFLAFKSHKIVFKWPYQMGHNVYKLWKLDLEQLLRNYQEGDLELPALPHVFLNKRKKSFHPTWCQKQLEIFGTFCLIHRKQMKSSSTWQAIMDR